MSIWAILQGDKDSLNALTDADVVQFEANARSTQLHCGGRAKRERNRLLCIAYGLELVRRGLVRAAEGEYNGRGSL